MATTKTPKPTLPTDTAADTTTAPETPPAPAPAPETPAANIGGSGKGSTKGASIEGHLLAADEIRPAITDHRVQLVSHIYPDGTCDAIPTMPPCLVIASRIAAAMMTVPRYITVLTGDDHERARDLQKIAKASLDIADELMQQAGARYFCTIPGDPEPIAAETDNPEA